MLRQSSASQIRHICSNVEGLTNQPGLHEFNLVVVHGLFSAEVSLASEPRL